MQKSRTGGWWQLPKTQEPPQAGQGGSHCFGCETGAHGGPPLEVLERHRASLEAVGGVMRFGAQRVRPLGHTAKEMGLQSTQPQNFTAETTLPDLCSARRDKPPPSASHFPLEGSPGWKLHVSGAIYRGEFPLQNPKSQRAGAISPGPSLHSATLKSSGNAKIMISFPVGA